MDAPVRPAPEADAEFIYLRGGGFGGEIVDFRCASAASLPPISPC